MPPWGEGAERLGLLGLLLESAVFLLITLSKAARQKVNDVVTQLMSDGKTPGLEVSIQKDGKTIYECGYGAIAKGPLPGFVSGQIVRATCVMIVFFLTFFISNHGFEVLFKREHSGNHLRSTASAASGEETCKQRAQ